MKNITFLKTGMENFMGYKDLMEFDFINDKVTLIIGPNGSGKSTIVDSVPFTLFGNTTKGTATSDVVNNEVGKNCHTYIEFIIEDFNESVKFRMDRYVKHSQFHDTVLLYKNDEKKPFKKGQREVLSVIEKLVCSQKLFTNTLLFGQKVKDFFTDLTDSEQKEIFRKVIQLENYVLYHEESKKKIKSLEDLLTKILQSLNVNENLILTVKNDIDKLNEDFKIFQINQKKEIEILKSNIITLENEFNELNKFLEKFSSLEIDKLDKINEDIINIQNQINNISTEYDSKLKNLSDNKNSKENEFKEKSKSLKLKEEMERNEKFNELSNKVKDFITENNNILLNCNNLVKTKKTKYDENLKILKQNEKEIKVYKDSLEQPESLCPTCGKPLTEPEVKNNLLNRLKDLISQNQILSDENNLLKDNILNLENIEIPILSKKISDKKEETTIDKQKIQFIYENNLRMIDQRVNTAFESIDKIFFDQKEKLDKQLELDKKDLLEKRKIYLNKKDEIILLKDKKDDLLKNITTKNSDIEIAKLKLTNKENEKFNIEFMNVYIERLEKLNKEKYELNSKKTEIMNEIEILEFWKTGFSPSGIPSILIDESIPFLNARISEYLEKVGGRYIASFDTLSTTKAGEYRDKIKVNVLDTKTKANNRKQLSGGQTRIIDIAILLSLCDLQNTIQDMKTNILLLDEVFDSLDDENIGYISNLFRTLVKDKSINIISHRHIDSIEADQILKLF